MVDSSDAASPASRGAAESSATTGGSVAPSVPPQSTSEFHSAAEQLADTTQQLCNELTTAAREILSQASHFALDQPKKCDAFMRQARLLIGKTSSISAEIEGWRGRWQAQKDIRRSLAPDPLAPAIKAWRDASNKAMDVLFARAARVEIPVPEFIRQDYMRCCSEDDTPDGATIVPDEAGGQTAAAALRANSMLTTAARQLCFEMSANGLENTSANLAASSRIVIGWLGESLVILRQLEEALGRMSSAEPDDTCNDNPFEKSMEVFHKRCEERTAFETRIALAERSKLGMRWAGDRLEPLPKRSK